ncbi:4-hydroxyphenylacetate 3-hydroxylase family protein [Capillimicrobium parvum]|uniref:4-hydroxyphenylacetate 3-monooxygenase oxygenase component n=1 Tax=Capillimicrobium parvum TaxID=2884022 RepID=A0A9E7BYJ8_9ACTN|nr:4-hydroxyphenylacetate 3-hydroxylase family protein [Capillimicrobium parvum]UGS34395.1 4-hydroxyphenylacetate 3-monooxygenase oxygenase component [Capillimicrobium parvum]
MDAPANNVLTGEQYLESLRDGREVWIDGERVADVTSHPAFRNAARSVARLYDAMHDPGQRDVLLAEDRHGILTHRFFMPSYDSQDLLDSRDAIASWSRMSYGYMGRTPDYKASFMATLGADPDWYEPFGDSGRRWYRKYAESVLFLNHVLINPPIDRHRAVHEVEDVYVHVVAERDGGMVVRGAKMLATGSALTHATFVAQNSAVELQEGKAEDYALCFIVPMASPGVKLISRASYEAKATSPFDAPLSARFDENDAVIVFDDVFVPWEDVLVYRDVRKATAFYAQSGFMPRYTLQSGTRLAVKLDFLCGLLARGLKANGTDGFRGVQAQLGELMGWRNLIWALTSTLCHETQSGPGGSVIPKLEYAVLIRQFGTQAFGLARQIFTEQLGGAPLVVPSSAQDLLSEELRPTLDRYYRGSDGDAHDRIKLFKLIWDAVGSEFGDRHAWYEVNYSGNQEQIRLDTLRFSGIGGITAGQQELVDACLADYDLDGWARGPWTS